MFMTEVIRTCTLNLLDIANYTCYIVYPHFVVSPTCTFYSKLISPVNNANILLVLWDIAIKWIVSLFMYQKMITKKLSK